MFKQIRWQIILGAGLTAASVLLYLTQIEIFHNTHDTFFYLFQDLAFFPIQVLLATLVLNEILTAREKIGKMKKIYMIIGIFFSETGTELLKKLTGFDQECLRIRDHLLVKEHWTKAEFTLAGKKVQRHDCKIECPKQDFLMIRNLLAGKRETILGLLQTPYLLEHETFTDLLLAVSHLTEELSFRTDLDRLSEKDCQHLFGDIRRAYILLITEWLAYLKHLKENYPYLYSLALRTNPFDPNASAAFK